MLRVFAVWQHWLIKKGTCISIMKLEDISSSISSSTANISITTLSTATTNTYTTISILMPRMGMRGELAFA